MSTTTMQDLATFDRRNQILLFLQENHRASTRKLSNLFRVSEVTIRNDLQTLEDQGWIERIHGGAQVRPEWVQESPLVVRETQNRTIKARIAQVAKDFINNGDTILIDSSTTALQLTLFLTNRSNLTIISNNLYVAQILAPNEQIHVVILGGTIRGSTGSVVGPMAEDFATNLHIDKAFFGAAGVSLERGFTDADIREVQIKRKMAQTADQIYALVDSSKFGKESFSTTFALDQVDHVISDQIPTEFESLFNQRKIATSIVPKFLR